MQAQARRGDLDHRQVVRRGARQSFDQSHGRGDLDAAAQFDDDAFAAAVVARGDRMAGLAARPWARSKSCSEIAMDRAPFIAESGGVPVQSRRHRSRFAQAEVVDLA